MTNKRNDVVLKKGWYRKIRDIKEKKSEKKWKGADIPAVILVNKKKRMFFLPLLEILFNFVIKYY